MPIDEMLAARDALRIAENLRPAVRRGPKSHDVGSMSDKLIVSVMRLMIKGGVDRHGEVSAIVTYWVCDCVWAKRFDGLGVLRAKNVS